MDHPFRGERDKTGMENLPCLSLGTSQRTQFVSLSPHRSKGMRNPTKEGTKGIDRETTECRRTVVGVRRTKQKATNNTWGMEMARLAQVSELCKAVSWGWSHRKPGCEATYGQLLRMATEVAEDILPGEGGKPARIAILVRPGPEYVVATFAAWIKGACVVPLALTHPLEELEYVHNDSKVTQTIVGKDYMDQAKALEEKVAAKILCLEDITSHDQQKEASHQENRRTWSDIQSQLRSQTPGNRDSLVIYTSGTTGKPKGAVHTHHGISAMVDSLVRSWEWDRTDRILNTLPLHHIHGIVNALYCPLSVGACVEFLPKFNALNVWERLMDLKAPPISVFMGVPTMYHHLISTYDSFPPEQKKVASAAIQKLRLVVSGSASCPLPVMKRWEEICGRSLLERYGMTEVGMVLSNPLRGERRPGTVGFPLPGVEVSVMTEDGRRLPKTDGQTGELLVRSPSMFREYFGRVKETQNAFTSDGWFKTGDEVSVDEEGYWTIVGRRSADIIKQGGYKISAVEIEGKLLEHPDIVEVAVLGLPDEAYGQTVAALVVLSGNEGGVQSQPHALRQWCNPKLAPYKIPRHWRFVSEIPRNAMGKVNKKELVKFFA